MKNFNVGSGNVDDPRPEMHSSISGAGGHGSMREKRASVSEVYGKLQRIISILPEDSKKALGRQADLIRKDPARAIEIIRNQIEANRALIDLLENSMSVDEALRQLDKLLPKEMIP